MWARTMNSSDRCCPASSKLILFLKEHWQNAVALLELEFLLFIHLQATVQR